MTRSAEEFALSTDDVSTNDHRSTVRPPDHDRRVYDDIFQTLAGEDNPTPLVRLNRVELASGPLPDAYRLYAKLEWMNPFGSVKDRAASFLIRDLEERGKIGPGKSIVEPTSGNTGFSLAAMASVKGYGMRAVVPSKVPDEKKASLRIAGAQIDVINDELCPSPGMGDGSINIAKTHARAQPNKYAMPNQYENEANIRAHQETTGPEIWRQTEGRVTHVFASLGTAGTIVGLGRYLKSKNPDIRIVVVSPTEGHDVPGLRAFSELAAANLYDSSVVDERVEVEGELAFTRAVELLRTEGLRAGPSSGLIYEGARRVLDRDIRRGSEGVGVMIFCDDLFKYTSSFIRHMPELAGAVEARG